jgi:hypothetical protein
MRARLALVLTFLLFTTSVFAKEAWIAVSGTANGVFFSDARVFNPNDKTITIQAWYLPRGNSNNSAETPTSFTVEKRQMRVFDDIVATLLHRNDVGAIRFVSADDFVVTQRVYLSSTTACAPGGANPCTLGQFVQGLDVGSALKRGVILQLKSSSKFRTNIGAANTTTSVAHVTWRLYDKNNATIATKTEDLQPWGAFGPSEFAGYFSAPAGSDLTDAWVGFSSDQPIFAYGSVVDNSSGDQTCIQASFDSGTVSDSQPQQKVVTIVASDFQFDTQTTGGALKQNDSVKFRLSETEGSHGFQFVDPDGNPLIVVNALTTTVTERTVVLPKKGTYFYFCTNTLCGTGHTAMTGSLNIGEPTNPGPPDGY